MLMAIGGESRLFLYTIVHLFLGYKKEVWVLLTFKRHLKFLRWKIFDWNYIFLQICLKGIAKATVILG